MKKKLSFVIIQTGKQPFVVPSSNTDFHGPQWSDNFKKRK